MAETSSTLTILKVEQYRDLGTVVHIRVDNIHMVNPLKSNVIMDIPHIPFNEEAIRHSVTRLLQTGGDIPDFREGYNVWKKAYLSEEAVAFNIPVRNALDAMVGVSWREEKYQL